MARRKKQRRRKVASANKRIEKRASMDGTGYLDLPEGVNQLRFKSAGIYKLDIIPYEVTVDHNPFAEKGDLYYERTFYIHKGVGAEEQSVVCAKKTMKKKCPVCNWRAKQAQDPDRDDDVIDALKPKERQLFNVIDLKDRDKGIQVLDMSYYLFGEKLDGQIKLGDEDDNYDEFHDIENGYTLVISIVEKGYRGIKYYAAESITFKPRRKPYDDSIIDEAHNLDELLIVPEFKELESMLLQIEPGDDEEEDDSPVSSRRSKKKQPEPEPEEEEDDWEEEEEEEEEKPAPKKKASRRKKQPEPEPEEEEDDWEEDDDSDDDSDDDDWDDDDWDEEEEEEEEKPAPKKKRRSRK